MTALCWWNENSPYRHKDAIICDGAVRSGKTFCLCLSFCIWATLGSTDSDFALCGKTIGSLRRIIVRPVLPALRNLGFEVSEKLSGNTVEISAFGHTNRFYLFGGRDESSASLIQGMTLTGVLFDEVVLMPRSFVEQALARCSVEGSKIWFSCEPCLNEAGADYFYVAWK